MLKKTNIFILTLVVGLLNPVVNAEASTIEQERKYETDFKQVVEIVPQKLVIENVALDVPARDSYEVIKPQPKPAPKPASTPRVAFVPPASPAPIGEAQAYAASLVPADQFGCLVELWNRESGWRTNAYNARSGAGGIPQALPMSKMASAGPDWQTSYVTQINWGLGYIANRYGTPCNAWEHFLRKNWY